MAARGARIRAARRRIGTRDDPHAHRPPAVGAPPDRRARVPRRHHLPPPAERPLHAADLGARDPRGRGPVPPRPVDHPTQGDAGQLRLPRRVGHRPARVDPHAAGAAVGAGHDGLGRGPGRRCVRRRARPGGGRRDRRPGHRRRCLDRPRPPGVRRRRRAAGGPARRRVLLARARAPHRAVPAHHPGRRRAGHSAGGQVLVRGAGRAGSRAVAEGAARRARLAAAPGRVGGREPVQRRELPLRGRPAAGHRRARRQPVGGHGRGRDDVRRRRPGRAPAHRVAFSGLRAWRRRGALVGVAERGGAGCARRGSPRCWRRSR